ncbi:hypothetical protein OS493_006621 [Desmophyllum pertusum]|uniref:Uncharacterized protein n=1 Tax=Desmophyllum pertusum TaxID=174260 RepID=A0A9X0D4X2_9CNID|nr:hypothetical protein OS493_006621 [Desmophyllum pertusum]
MACDQKIVNVDEGYSGRTCTSVVESSGWASRRQCVGLLEKEWRVTVHVQVKEIIPYNDDFGLELYGEAITMATDFPDIFGSTQSNGFGY